MIPKELLSKRRYLNEKIHEIQQELSTLPTGNIYCVHDGNRLKWFHNDGHGAKYLSKKNPSLISALANRKYLTCLLNSYQKEIYAIDSYLNLHNPNLEEKAQKLLEQSSYKHVITTNFQTLSQELDTWMHEPYERSNYHPEHLIYPTASGNTVRSKSEAIIDMLLHMHQIPYRYEAPLPLGNSIIFPDFTIRHPQTGKTKYWEHFGIMDDTYYCNSALSKIQNYSNYGIIPGDQLIMTFESKQVPFNPEVAEQLIRHHFLT